MIYVIGLGAGSEAHLTTETLDILNKQNKDLYLRTEIHPTVNYLTKNQIEYKSFDYLYKKSESFAEIYEEITDNLIEYAKEKDLVYAVPGNPLVAEKSVFLLIDKAKKHNLEIKVFPALSSLEVIYASLKIDPLDGLIITDATNMKPSKIKRGISLMIVQVYAQHIASEVKLALSEIYPDTYPITVVKSAGIENEERIEEIPLYQLDRLDWIDHLTTVYIDANRFPLPDEDVEVSGNTEIDRLVNIVSYLRSPNGCPWDREQTHSSIKKHIIEEAYEVIEAIELNDMELFKDELGDLLLQVVLQSQIAVESGEFDFEDVAQAIGDKLIRRHPHVFGEKNPDLKDGHDVKNMWEKLKNKEKKDDESVMSGIPRALPSLIRAEKIQRKAASVGFDWADISGVFAKVHEEIAELQEAYKEENKAKIQEELGDLLFSIVNFTRWLKLDPEETLIKANDKFIGRFTKVENHIKNEKKEFKDYTLNQLEEIWQKNKAIDNRI